MEYKDLITSEGNLHLGNWKRFSKQENLIEKLKLDTLHLINVKDLERLYHVVNNLKAVPKCRVCGGELKFKLFKTGYAEYCSIKCSVNVEKTKRKRTATWLEKYGKGTDRRDEINKKIIETNLQRYGTPSHNQALDVKKKQKESKIAKYGIEYSKIAHNKARETLFENYGVINSFQLPEVRNKAIASQRKHAPEGFALLENKQSALSLYDQGTIKQIGDNLGISFSNVAAKLNNHGISLTKYASKSGLEKEVLEYIKSIYSGEIKSGDRSVLGNKKEIDILIPEFRFGIEFNGIYWHSDIEKEYHLNKTQIMEEKGYTLFHIFEDEWIEKRQIWKSMIRNKLGLSERIFGRKCKVSNIPRNIGEKFFKDNHLQGSLSVGNYLGLYYEDELVSCLSYGPSRFEKNCVEIYRYATKINKSVLGGFSKLLKKIEASKIVSYANKRWSKGEVYRKCGFKFLHDTPPNYFYVKDGRRFSRHSFQKHKLKDHPLINGYNPHLTEHEIMRNNGFKRIYDCGNKKFIINNNMTNSTL